VSTNVDCSKESFWQSTSKSIPVHAISRLVPDIEPGVALVDWPDSRC
jgi:hypothetical protein